MFKKAVKEQIKIRLALSGPSGSGKTFSALNIAKYLGSSVAVIDTEHESSLRYADKFDFDMCNLDDAHPAKYIEAITAAERAGYDVIIVDSMTHAWFKELEMAGGNFNNWAKVRPLERKLIDTIIGSKSHIIVTMRSKTEYAQENVNGKTKVTKLGTKAIQSDGIEYEFDIAGELSLEHILTVSKSRCVELTDKTFLNPGQVFADALLNWANSGEVVTPPTPQFAKPQAQTQAPPKQQQQPVKQETEAEDFPKPPGIWDTWNNAKDAVDWALTIINDADEDFLLSALKSLPKVEEKSEKGKLWVAMVNEFHATGNYKKAQELEPELEPNF